MCSVNFKVESHLPDQDNSLKTPKLSRVFPFQKFYQWIKSRIFPRETRLLNKPKYLPPNQTEASSEVRWPVPRHQYKVAKSITFTYLWSFHMLQSLPDYLRLRILTMHPCSCHLIPGQKLLDGKEYGLTTMNAHTYVTSVNKNLHICYLKNTSCWSLNLYLILSKKLNKWKEMLQCPT